MELLSAGALDREREITSQHKHQQTNRYAGKLNQEVQHFRMLYCIVPAICIYCGHGHILVELDLYLMGVKGFMCARETGATPIILAVTKE